MTFEITSRLEVTPGTVTGTMKKLTPLNLITHEFISVPPIEASSVTPFGRPMRLPVQDQDRSVGRHAVEPLDVAEVQGGAV
jgi:hypothetical protein